MMMLFNLYVEKKLLNIAEKQVEEEENSEALSRDGNFQKKKSFRRNKSF